MLPSDEPARDAAEVVAAIARQLGDEYSDVALFDLKYVHGYLADLGITPTAPGTVGMSLVGMGGEFVFTIIDKTYRRWEIENNSAGRAELDALLADVIEGRMAFSKWPRRAKGRYLPYR
jgi:hypothetical protein